MIKGVVLENLNSWVKEAKEFDPLHQTWLVSTLPSKLNIQQELFKSYKILPENAILRASEFWLQLAKRQNPYVRIVSPAWARSFLKEKLVDETDEWLKVPGASKTLLEYISQLIPLLMLDDDQLVYSWLKENTSSLIRWGRWYESAKKYFDVFKNNGWLLESWLPEYLNQQVQLPHWNKDVWVDLGSELSTSESKLLLKLSENHKIKVLCPSLLLEDSDQFQNVIQSYNLLSSDFLSVRSISEESLMEHSQVYEIKRFSTALSEVKDVVAQARIWIEQESISPNEIAIYSGDIEKYWPVLAPYLHAEGIPCVKNKIVNGNSFLQIQNWISKLKVHVQKVSTEDLELSLFATGEPPLTYLEFKRMYGLILNSTHLNRLEVVSEKFKNQLSLSTTMNRDEFLYWSLSNFSFKFKHEVLEMVVQKFLLQTNFDNKFLVSTWVELLEEVCSQIEIIVEKGDSEGLIFENLSYNHRTHIKRMYILGMSESVIDNRPRGGLQISEIEKLEQDLGVSLNFNSTKEFDFNLMWNLSSNQSKKILSFAQAQFDGEPDSPIGNWIRSAVHQKRVFDEMNIPKKTRWDDLQFLSTFSHDQDLSLIKKFIDRDLGHLESEVSSINLKKLSVSRLESYLACPSVFLFESLFKLKDARLLDFDADPLDKGRLMHALLQEITDSKLQFETEDLNSRIEQLKSQLEIEFFDQRSWSRIKNELIDMSKNFMEFEKKWRTQFPLTKTLAAEKKFKTYWNRDLKNFVSNPENSIEFNGSIDRIDSDQKGHALVLDYKSSDSSQTHYSKWLENGDLQLSIYSYLLENGFTDLGPMEVWGMGYFGIREMNRSKGLWCTEGNQSLFELNTRVKNFMDHKELKNYWSQVLNLVDQTISSMESGRLFPYPKDKTICDNCVWSDSCRAPHLN